jgi:hypothetical protein
MPKPDLKAIRARLEAATPGPWVFAYPEFMPKESVELGGGCSVYILREPDEYQEERSNIVAGSIESSDFTTVVGSWGDYGMDSGLDVSRSDADLIAHAPTDIAALLERCKELEDVVKDAISNSPGILLTEKSIKTMGIDTNEGPSEDPDA